MIIGDRTAVGATQNLRFVQAKHLGPSEETTRTQDGLKSPVSFPRQYCNYLMHAEVRVDHNTKQSEIFATSVCSMEHVERFLGSIESDTITSAPLMEIRLAA